MYFLRGSLPWQGLHVHKGEDRYKKILMKKKATSAEELCKGFPKQFIDYINYTRNLEFEADPDYKYLRQLLVSTLQESNAQFDFWYDWLNEKPTISDHIAVERYIKNNTNISLELKEEKKEKEGETKDNENEKENVSLQYNSLSTSLSMNDGKKNLYSKEALNTNNAGINIPVDGNVTYGSVEKKEDSVDNKKDNKKGKEGKNKNKKDKHGRNCSIW